MRLYWHSHLSRNVTSASALSAAEWILIRKVACSAKLMRVYEAEYL
jgi:hypothetical protein